MAMVSVERVGKQERHGRGDVVQLYTVFRDDVAYSMRICGHHYDGVVQWDLQILRGFEWKYMHKLTASGDKVPDIADAQSRWLEMEALMPVIMATECTLDGSVQFERFEPRAEFESKGR